MLLKFYRPLILCSLLSRCSSNGALFPFVSSLDALSISLTNAQGLGSWEDHAVISSGKFLFWLVSLSSGNIWGFIVRGIALSLFTQSHISPLDLNSSSYLVYLIAESPTRRLSSSSLHRSLSISDTVISISTNNTITARNLRDYVPGISDQQLYLLSSGIE
jgi:hypothetical protein